MTSLALVLSVVEDKTAAAAVSATAWDGCAAVLRWVLPRCADGGTS